MSTGANEDSTDPDCRRCRHYHLTWEPFLPHGCHSHGFRSRFMPAVEVRLADGGPCLAFEPQSGVRAAVISAEDQPHYRGRLYDHKC
jgi:hypothetical protein